MKKILNTLIALLLILTLPIFIFSNFNLLLSKRDLSAAFATDFIPKNEYLTDKSFVFILYSSDPTSSNFEQNLTSIFNQKYDKFRVVLIVTENLEPFLDQIQRTAAKCDKQHLLALLPLTERAPTLHSFRKAIELCKDDEIVIHMDASGWLAHENVLSTLNKIYASSEDIWLTHSPSIEYPSYAKAPKTTPWHSSHFKTYYAGLFKQLNQTPPSHPLNETNLNHYLQPLTKNSKKHIHFVEAALYIRKHAN